VSILIDYKYYRPEELQNCLDLLDRYEKKAVVLAGGTDLVSGLKDEKYDVSAVVDIKGIKELGAIVNKEDRLFIGAGVTFDDLLRNTVVRNNYPLIYESSILMGSMGIRNRATLVGNICAAVPSLDSGAAVILYDSSVQLKSIKAERSVPIEKWFLAPQKTAIEPGEIVTGITLRSPGDHGSCYLKKGRYRGQDLAQVGVGILALKENEYRVAFSAVGPVPLRARSLEKHFSGKIIDNSVFDDMLYKVEEVISPITDIRSSKEYRYHMAKIMFKRALFAARARLNGNGPNYGEVSV